MLGPNVYALLAGLVAFRQRVTRMPFFGGLRGLLCGHMGCVLGPAAAICRADF
jgi:hypothetical protein